MVIARGKTTPSSTAGSFAAKPAARSRVEMAAESSTGRVHSLAGGVMPSGVRGSDVPREGVLAPSSMDHPADYHWADATFSLRMVALDEVLAGMESGGKCFGPGGRHGVACYDLAVNPDGRFHDVDEEPGFDVAYVGRLAGSAEVLPSLVLARDGDGVLGMFGGGHRTAAWREAGLTHVPCWVVD